MGIRGTFLSTLGGRFFHLMISIFAVLLLYGIFADVEIGRMVVELGFSAMLLLSIRAICEKKAAFFSAAALFMVVIILRWIAEFSNIHSIVVFSNAITIANLTTIAIIILNNVLKNKVVTFDDIYGAISVYLLIAIIFALIFALIQDTNIRSFTHLYYATKHLYLDLPEFIYFSFITLTTVGYGDIAPITHIAKTLTYMEAIIGQIYMVVLIARLLALYVSHKTGHHE